MGHPSVAGRSIRARYLLLTLLTGAGFALAGGCGADDEERIRAAELAEGCVLNTDCTSPLVCAFKKCHVQCNDSRDCQPAELCVPSGEKPFNVCLLESETLCVYHSDCPAQHLLCAKDQHCRPQCKTKLDCLPEQWCADGSCADADEVVDGGLPDPPDGGKDSSIGDTCVYTSDCDPPLVCKGGACMPECKTSVDCPHGFSCQALPGDTEKSCVAPVSDAGGTDGGGTDGGGTDGGVTDGGVIVPLCANGKLDPGETGVDCGGSCGSCNGAACTKPSDCASNVCKALSCAAPSCTDGLQNGLESDVDCGPGCGKCGAQKGCWTDVDCSSGICKLGTCTPAGCTDTTKNGAESDVDCGGSECPACAVGKACITNSDCASQNCVDKKCVAAGPTKWVKAFGASGRADVDVDAQGNVLFAGEYNGAFDFGGGKLTPSSSDWILAKYTPAGAHLWSRRQGSSGWDDYTFAGFDPSGDVLAYGKIATDGSFGGPVLGCDNSFVIAKYKGSDGSHVWSRCYDGNGGVAVPLAAAIDPAGDFIVAGTFYGTIDFGNNNIFSSSWARGYLAKYSGLTGDLVWVRVFFSAAAPSSAQEITVLKATATGIWAAGRLRNSVDFGGGVVLGVPLGAYPDVFALELGKDGTTLKGKAWGSSGDEGPVDLELIGSDLLLTGFLANPIDFGTGVPLQTFGGKDMFLVRLKTSDLSAVWAKSFGAAQDDVAGSVATLANGEIALVGSVGAGVSFGGGPLPNMGNTDYFLATFTGTGAHVSSKAWGGAAADHGRSVHALSAGLVLSATFSGASAMIDMGTGVLPAVYGDNMVLAHLP